MLETKQPCLAWTVHVFCCGVGSSNDGVLECKSWVGYTPLPPLLLLTFNGIWFESLWIIPMGMGFVGHCAIMVCSWSVWGRIYACVWMRVWVCVSGGGGAGAQHRGFVCSSGRCIPHRTAVGGLRVNSPTPSGLTHKSFPLGNKGIIEETD